MSNLKIGEKYTDKNSTREVVKIKGYRVYYKTESGKQKSCLITSFEDWLRKNKKKYDVNLNTKRNKRTKYDKVSFEQLFTELRYYLQTRDILYPELKNKKISCFELGRNTKYPWHQYRDNEQIRIKINELNSLKRTNPELYTMFDGIIPGDLPEILDSESFVRKYSDDKHLLALMIKKNIENLINIFKSANIEKIKLQDNNITKNLKDKEIAELKKSINELTEAASKRINEFVTKINNL